MLGAIASQNKNKKINEPAPRKAKSTSKKKIIVKFPKNYNKIVTINLVHIYKIQNQNKLNYGY